MVASDGDVSGDIVFVPLSLRHYVPYCERKDSLKWTALAFFLPTVTGVSICFIMNMLWMLLS